MGQDTSRALRVSWPAGSLCFLNGGLTGRLCTRQGKRSQVSPETLSSTLSKHTGPADRGQTSSLGASGCGGVYGIEPSGEGEQGEPTKGR